MGLIEKHGGPDRKVRAAAALYKTRSVSYLWSTEDMWRIRSTILLE